MTLSIAEIAGDYVFQSRVQAVLVSKAYEFLSVQSETTQAYMKKKRLADSIIIDARARTEAGSWAVVNTLPIDSIGSIDDISDQQIVDGISSSWGALAGVAPGDELLSSLPQNIQTIMDMQQTITDLQARLDAANL